ncbi:GNAT family N-acetyltransferase [Staphylococcus xylosus]|nr:GNAT family N-acetyltransferase [Staphylococcus xylosus]MCE7782020.1 GNAT family N-acetyltransferase [Staphylococcus xylosus]
MNYSEHTIPDTENLKNLYASVGWWNYLSTDYNIQELIKNMDYVATVWNGSELIGLIRALSDDCSVVFIQDILIKPQYQRQGIGRKLITMTLNRYKHVRQIILITDNNEKTNDFYQSLNMNKLESYHCNGFMI